MTHDSPKSLAAEDAMVRCAQVKEEKTMADRLTQKLDELATALERADYALAHILPAVARARVRDAANALVLAKVEAGLLRAENERDVKWLRAENEQLGATNIRLCVAVAERDRLRAALQPFAEFAEKMDESIPKGMREADGEQLSDLLVESPTMLDCRRARAALEGKP